MISLRSPDTTSFSRLTLRVSGGNHVSSARSQAGLGIALSMREEYAPLHWIPVNSRLCEVRFNGSVRFSGIRMKRRYLFIAYAHKSLIPTPPEVKDEFHRELSQ